MERRLNKKAEGYISEFKDNIREKMSQLGLLEFSNGRQLLQFIYDYERLGFAKEDFMKRKRVKNVVHLFDRCCAKRANGEQCTRRKKNPEDQFCGTHMKGCPHGIVEEDTNSISNVKNTNLQVEVWAQEIQGIVYYIDKGNNVYQTEDIIANKINPKIIAKWTKQLNNSGNETYSIPEFGLN
jgi:hypothetical protein